MSNILTIGAIQQVISNAGLTQLAFTITGATTWEVPVGVTTVEVLVVAGGGGGGRDRGGGGGAGALIYNAAYGVTPGETVGITVGAGGAGGYDTNKSNGSKGGDSIFSGITAEGGGYGAGQVDGISGGTGGCGGAAGRAIAYGAAGIGNVGFNGGVGTSPTTALGSAGGGGGMGAAGYNGQHDDTPEMSGATTSGGGVGLYYGDKFGNAVGENGWFCGGGAGGYANELGGVFPPVGGLGGGADYAGCGVDAEDGLANTGGGGASTCSPSKLIYGGSGVVIIRY